MVLRKALQLDRKCISKHSERRVALLPMSSHSPRLKSTSTTTTFNQLGLYTIYSLAILSGMLAHSCNNSVSQSHVTTVQCLKIKHIQNKSFSSFSNIRTRKKTDLSIDLYTYISRVNRQHKFRKKDF